MELRENKVFIGKDGNLSTLISEYYCHHTGSNLGLISATSMGTWLRNLSNMGTRLHNLSSMRTQLRNLSSMGTRLRNLSSVTNEGNLWAEEGSFFVWPKVGIERPKWNFVSAWVEPFLYPLGFKEHTESLKRREETESSLQTTTSQLRDLRNNLAASCQLDDWSTQSCDAVLGRLEVGNVYSDFCCEKIPLSRVHEGRSHHVMWRDVTWSDVTPHHTKPHHTAPHRIASHHITSHHITSHHITSHHITSHHITPHHTTSFRILLEN